MEGNSGRAARKARPAYRSWLRQQGPLVAAHPAQAPSPESSPEVSILVFTPIGHRQLTRTPRSPYVTLSHSAKATAACLVTAYVAEPIWVSRPAAEAVLTK
ncbi:hypothetical protein GCM10014713_51310 [Streptomyces purpureus]|uniref:Uncharacterized protein n=1 Tax=Streptomyces purpureus TaxID=1951 RepID=A0A918HCN1_9ACTN|nr:hypothetical protein GCM10014713_51310 [Streptomyces purpureus]